jgi:hypothetical protein
MDSEFLRFFGLKKIMVRDFKFRLCVRNPILGSREFGKSGVWALKEYQI